ncbi:MAG TPA: HD domain-containing phosphohydrolase, partial [Oligoflexia bacterium]|nr:HD domain-containing phosphohydrolase [Oligoflexia bacterium]
FERSWSKEPFMAGKYFPVDIKMFRNSAKDITFDVYLKLAEDNYAHVFSRSSGVDYKRLAQYISKGITHLFVREEDDLLFREYMKKSPDKMLFDPEVPDAKKVSLLLNMAEQNLNELFNVVAIGNEVAASSTKVVKSFITMMGQNPKTLATLLRTASHGEYLFYHSISVAVISMYLAKATGQANPRMLEICGMGGFLHDIGLTMLPKEVVDSPTDLTPAQWREMRSHPKLGVKMIEATPNIPDEVRYIVFQHHEAPDGSGYPGGLRGPVIFYPAKIVGLADSFCALITKRPFREAYTIEQALGILQHEVGKYDRDLVKVLVGLFGDKKKAAAA